MSLFCTIILEKGKYIGSHGLGAVILSVKSLDVVLANGELVHTSPTEKTELFFACVGCYNAVAVIANVELELENNVTVKRSHRKMLRSFYKQYFFENIRNNSKVVFHNGDIYPPLFKNVRAVSWTKTNEKPTVNTRLIPLAAAYPIERYCIVSLYFLFQEKKSYNYCSRRRGCNSKGMVSYKQKFSYS